ncbi:MAG: hypothetical protein ACFFCZ_24465 [Promethearchaeota archaeon]
MSVVIEIVVNLFKKGYELWKQVWACSGYDSSTIKYYLMMAKDEEISRSVIGAYACNGGGPGYGTCSILSYNLMTAADEEISRSAIGAYACPEGSSPCSILSLIIQLIGTVTYTLVMFILGVLQAFDPKGPLFLGILTGSVLAVSFTGIRFKTRTCQGNCDSVRERVCDSVKTTWGRLTFVHSHHKPHLREANHEFKIGHKYFCTGCYGTLIGTTIVLLLMSAYVLFGLTADLAFLVRLAIPICFIPIALRYAVFKQMRTPLRLLSNILFPIGGGLLLVLCDYTFHSWILNVGVVLLIVVIVFVRMNVSAKENKEPVKLPAS